MSGAVARGPALALTILIARLRQRVGVPGLLGLGLVAVAAAAMSLAWRQHQRLDLAPSAPGLPMVHAVPATMPRPPKTEMPEHAALPPVSDIPILLTRIQRAALDAGLGWPRADYRVNAATEDAPASLEVRCTLKGPYPSIRRFVTTLLQDAPTLTLREFGLSRANADAGGVEAKLSFTVYLASGASHAIGLPR
ncbi:MAG TPA: hypothetical protein VFA35_07870 [Burkholderiaceae bacterium]|nr:hypothetical protein [Burkholderiaceae bacterium]